MIPAAGPAAAACLTGTLFLAGPGTGSAVAGGPVAASAAKALVTTSAARIGRPAESASGAAAPGAATLLLRTVPSMPAVRVTFDGTTYLTGTQGWVVIQTISGIHDISVQPPLTSPPGTKVVFGRWLDGLVVPSRRILVRQGTHFDEVGFVLARPVMLRFTDQAGRPVPASRISKVTLSSNVGQSLMFSPAHPPQRLPVNRIVRGRSDLRVQYLRYSVRQVYIHGADVVHGGSQVFHVWQHQTWVVRVLLFPLRVEVRDAFFGFPEGSAVRLVFPDGSRTSMALGHGHSLLLRGLPRATYELTAVGPGIGLTAPTSLSRPQFARVLLLSWLDLLSVALFAVLFLLGLPLLSGRVRRLGGRSLPTWRARRIRQAPALDEAAEDGPADAVSGGPRTGRPASTSNERRRS